MRLLRSVSAVQCKSPKRDWEVNREMKGWGLGEWPLMEESSDIYGALRLKRHDANFHITVLISFRTKNGHRESGKNIAVLKRAMSKKSAGLVSKRLDLEKPIGTALPSKMQDRVRKTSGNARNLEQSGKKSPIYVEELGVLVKEKESTSIKSCKESSKRETDVYAKSEGVAEEAKVDDGARSRLSSALKQLRKDTEEERAARELLE